MIYRVKYYERAILNKSKIMELALVTKLEKDYYKSGNLKILDEGNNKLSKWSIESNFTVDNSIKVIPKTTLVSSTTKSYTDMLCGK